jgi:hypothetical protein
MHSSNGVLATKISGAGTYNADISISFSGATLRLVSSTGTALSGIVSITGKSTKSIVLSV